MFDYTDFKNDQSQLSINDKSSNLINGAIISKMTTRILIRGSEFTKRDQNDSMKAMIDSVFLERS